MKPISINPERFTTPQTDAPHELSAAVNRIEQAGLFTSTYDRGYWLKLVKFAGFDHPEHEIKRLLKTMFDRKDWLLKSKGQEMNCGGWLTDRLKEEAAGPQPRS